MTVSTATLDELRRTCRDMLACLDQQPSPQRIKTAAAVMEQMQQIVADLAAVRRSGVSCRRAGLDPATDR